MNTLKPTSPSNLDIDMTEKKTPLRKDELEKIAKELKKKLSKASITAKQQLTPSKIAKSTDSSPLNLGKHLESPNKTHDLSSSPLIYSPNNKSPTHIKNSGAINLLSSSPIIESPSKKSKYSSPLKNQPTMVLQSISTTASNGPMPSPPLKAQTTPTLQKRQLATPNKNQGLLKTPTQRKPETFKNDNEGADLLMYLATSPSPVKNYFSNTPKSNNAPTIKETSSAPTSAAKFPIHKHTSSNSSANSFVAPPPPLTPKRHNIPMSKTPQNRLTPSVNLFNNINAQSGNLPSSGLALTPAGFNMNDYVNFFSPSPGGINLNKNLNSNFLKTPDFNNLLASSGNLKQSVDGKMINFDKVGLFKNGESKE